MGPVQEHASEERDEGRGPNLDAVWEAALRALAGWTTRRHCSQAETQAERPLRLDDKAALDKAASDARSFFASIPAGLKLAARLSSEGGEKSGSLASISKAVNLAKVQEDSLGEVGARFAESIIDHAPGDQETGDANEEDEKSNLAAAQDLTVLTAEIKDEALKYRDEYSGQCGLSLAPHPN